MEMANPAGSRAQGADQLNRSSSEWLQYATVMHVSVLAIGSAWALGGNTEWARVALSCWGSLSLVLIIAGIRNRMHAETAPFPAILWPLIAFDLLVLASLFNPSFREIHRGADIVFVTDPMLPPFGFLPSTARPDLSWRALWFFNVAYLSAFNLALNVRRRRILRGFILLVVGNAVVLAVIGTLQQLVSATSPYFGAIRTGQPHFFSTFIYHNHWSAFTLLMLAGAIALVFYYFERQRRLFFRSPGFAVLVGSVLLATTFPLSGSRSGTLLGGILLAVAFIHWIQHGVRSARRKHRRLIAPLLAGAFAAAASFSFIYTLAEPVIRTRLSDTQTQVTEARARGEIFPRQVLYHDTWNLARDRLWFGWGMAAYPTAFYLRNTQQTAPDGLPRLFHDAHSDWLQSIADVGLVGTLLLVGCGLAPWWKLRGQLCWRTFPMYLIFGCTLVLLYAALEFPFGNRSVVIAFWCLWFSALRYAQLQHSDPLRA